jgi:hypothetical protein
MTHEITHVLQGTLHHSLTGVMKENWNREDFKRIEAGKFPFDPRDVELIRQGIEQTLAALVANSPLCHRPFS